MTLNALNGNRCGFGTRKGCCTSAMMTVTDKQCNFPGLQLSAQDSLFHPNYSVSGSRARIRNRCDLEYHRPAILRATTGRAGGREVAMGGDSDRGCGPGLVTGAARNSPPDRSRRSSLASWFTIDRWRRAPLSHNRIGGERARASRSACPCPSDGIARDLHAGRLTQRPPPLRLGPQLNCRGAVGPGTGRNRAAEGVGALN